MAVRATCIVCALAALAASTANAALPQRTFVASTGNDGSPCTLALPCRSFGVAIAHAGLGGEVVALDSAGYGAMTIAQSVSVIAPRGVHAAISVSGTTAVAIGAGAGSLVTLRGLAISNLTSGATGIQNFSGADLRIENCIVDGFDYSVSHGGPGTLSIADSRLTRGTLQIGGIGGPVRYSIERTYITSGLAHQWAVLALGDSHGSIKSSTIENNGTVSYGIRTNTNTVPATPVEVLVEDSIIQGHNYGVYSDATGGSVSNVSLSNSQLLANSHAIETSHGGTVALVSSRIAYNGFGVTISTLGGPVYTDGRNWFGYNFGDLNGGATLTGPAGIR